MWFIVIGQAFLTTIVYWMEKQMILKQSSISFPMKSTESSFWSSMLMGSSKISATSPTKMTSNSLSTTSEINNVSKFQMQQDLITNSTNLEKDVWVLDSSIVLDELIIDQSFNSIDSSEIYFNTWNLFWTLPRNEQLESLFVSQSIPGSSIENDYLNQSIEIIDEEKSLWLIDELSVNDSPILDWNYYHNFMVGQYYDFALKYANFYSYSVSASGYISISTTTTNLKIKWLKPWKVTLYIKHSDVLYHRLYLTIDKELNASISNTNIQRWNDAIVSVISWNDGYSLFSSNTSVATVSGSGTSWRVYWIWFGSSTLTIRDGLGYSKSIVINVLPRDLKLSVYSMNIYQWEYWYFNIIDGNWNYIIAKNNGNINVMLNWISTSYKVLWVWVWQTIAEIRDGQWKKAQLIVTVSPKIQQLQLDKTNINIAVWQTDYFRITSGNWSYILTRSNNNVSYSQNWSDTHYSVSWNYPWSSIITVVDRHDQKAQIYVNVIQNDYDLSLDKSSIDIFQWNNESFRIVTWNWNYTVTTSNTSIANIYWYWSNWTVRWINPWTAIVTVKDWKGKVSKINVLVKANPKVAISNIKYSRNVYNDWLGWATFEVVWEHLQAWIDYYFKSNVWTNISDSLDTISDWFIIKWGSNYDKQSLSMSKDFWSIENIQIYSRNFDLQKDNLYSFMLDMNCSNMINCQLYFKPYVKDLAGNKYYGSNEWFSISKNWNQYSKMMLDNSFVQDIVVLDWDYSFESSKTMWYSNSNLEDGLILDSVNDDFGINIYQIWESVTNFVRSNKWIYDWSVDALNDQIQDLKSALDPQTYKDLVKQLKMLALEFYDKWFDQFKYLINNVSSLWAELLDSLTEWFHAVLSLSVYDKQYYSSYFGTVMMISQITSKLPIPKQVYNKLLNKIHEARTKWLKIKLLSVSKLTYAYTKYFIDFVRKVEKFWWDYVKKLDDYIILIDSKFQWDDSYEFIHKLLNNSDAAIKDALDNQQVWIIFYKLQVWKEKLTKHVFEGDISLIKPYKLSWVHFKTALKEYDKWLVTHGDVVRFNWEIVKTNIYWDEYFNYNIRSYSQEKFIEDFNNNMIPWDKKGWVFKRWISTFFPDTRTVEKVKAEVELAFKNLTMCLDKNTRRLVKCWRMSDWVFVNFYENGDDLENLSTAFPNLNLELAQ